VLVENALRLCRLGGALEVAQAMTTADLDAAFTLLHDRYVERGYIEPHPSGRRMTVHHALPDTRVFVARCQARVVGTVSLIPDSLFGMPCDDLYPAEVAAMRSRGRRLAEVSALAIDRRWRSAGPAIIRSLIQLVAVHGSRAPVDDLCVTVHPRHARFYELRLAFEPFGPPRLYTALNDAPAVALRLDVRAALERVRAVPLKFFQRQAPPSPSFAPTGAQEVC
jgi:hypothetical protein